MKKYVIGIAISIMIILFLIFGGYYIYSSNHSQDSVELLKAKVDVEIDYLSSTIVEMMNRLNHISYENYKIVEEVVPSENETTQSSSEGESEGSSQEKSDSKSQGGSNTVTNMNMNYSSILVNSSKKIDWVTIKKEIEKMYKTWNTVLIDLNGLSVNQDDILKYSTVLNRVTKAVQKEDKKATLYNLADLYDLLVIYTKGYSHNNQQIILMDVRSNILYAYALAEDSKWQEIQNYIKKAQSVFNNMMNTTLQNDKNITNINKTYVLLNEIYKSTDSKDKDIFYIYYKNLMQELDVMGEVVS